MKKLVLSAVARPGLRSNIAAFAQCKAAGERVVAMFEHGAFLAFRNHESDWIQVKIGACKRHAPNLEHLNRLIGQDQRELITEEMIREAVSL